MMSKSFRLFLLLLCMSLQVCNARHLRTLHKINETTVSFPLKDEEKKGLVAIQSKKIEGTSSTDGEVKNVGWNAETQKATRKGSSKVKGRHAGHSRTDESLATVSWRVPHEKLPGEKDPGFNLDYSPPKTHPPSHN